MHSNAHFTYTPKTPAMSNFHCSDIGLVCTASLISRSNLYPSKHLRADSFISLSHYVSPLQARCREYLNILGIIILPIICHTNGIFPVFYGASVLCFISLHLVFSLIFFPPVWDFIGLLLVLFLGRMYSSPKEGKWLRQYRKGQMLAFIRKKEYYKTWFCVFARRLNNK